MLRHALEAQGHFVLEARDEPEALHHLQQSRPAVVLTDLKLPAGDGFGVLRAAKELDPELQVVVMTAFGSIQDAVTAMKQGAMDFLAKPVDPDHLNLMVERAIAQRRMLSEYVLLKEELAQRRGAPRIIGEDPQLRQVSQQLHRAAQTDATVLLEGESGTGKELFARALHALSPRADGPFVAINCAALVETLLEAELFGIEERTATGVRGRRGKFEHADGGTLFLDEVADLSLAAQAKLLRAIQEMAVERVGGHGTRRLNVRIVAATNTSLTGLVQRSLFRADLYYRLSGLDLRVPALRHRREDVPELADYFLACHDERSRRALSATARDALSAYDWPGNVRELQRTLEGAMAIAESRLIDLDDLPPALRTPYADVVEPSLDANDSLRMWASRYTRLVLERSGHNKRRACRTLGISYHTLQAHLRYPARPANPRRVEDDVA